MATPTLASAFAFPEPDSPPVPEPRGLRSKRRQSSVDLPNGSKRPRLSSLSRDLQQAENQAELEARRDRAASGAMEERKRGQRLFGALLNTLSQAGASTQKRRDVDSKQAEYLRKQKEQDDLSRKIQYEQLMAVRRREQWKVDEQNMRTRHSNMRYKAHFLMTTAEPKLHYKPWRLTEDQEDHLVDQLLEVETLIEREREEFQEMRKRERSPSEAKSLSRHMKTASTNGDEHLQQQNAAASPNAVGQELPAEAPVTQNENENTDVAHPSSESTNEHGVSEKKMEPQDDAGDMIEAEEDTVIY
ncbi:hypothetical protein LTR66_010579 [Elasticomyces elasticus]|nr:hypothetical protein LTR66_010579 [Elasticomyces elasticus]